MGFILKSLLLLFGLMVLGSILDNLGSELQAAQGEWHERVERSKNAFEEGLVAADDRLTGVGR